MNRDDEVQVWRRLAALEQRSGQIYDQLYLTYVPLDVPVSAINGGTYSTVGASVEITAATLGVPSVARAISCRLQCRDSSASTTTQFNIGHSATYFYDLVAYAIVANCYGVSSGVCPTDSNASIWYQCTASGVNTLTVYLVITGYFV